MLDLVSFENKTIIVAGVGGIGAAIARMLNKLNAKIVLIDTNQRAMDIVLKSLHGDNRSYLHDFIDISGISTLVDTIVSEVSPIDGFIFCVGVSDSRPLKLSSFDFMQRIMTINFFSYIEFVRQLTRKGNYRRGFNIVGISSVGAILGNSAQTAYAASKAAMNGAIRCIAKELAPKGIRINNIAPGSTNTTMFQKAATLHGQDLGFKSRLERQYLGLCEPEDISYAALFLLSDMSRMITGSCLGVDGGKLTS